MAGFNYSINVTSVDCVGCALCVDACPDDALVMTDVEDTHKFTPYFDYAMTLDNKPNPMDKYTVKGS